MEYDNAELNFAFVPSGFKLDVPWIEYIAQTCKFDMEDLCYVGFVAKESISNLQQVVKTGSDILVSLLNHRGEALIVIERAKNNLDIDLSNFLCGWEESSEQSTKYRSWNFY